MNVIKQYLGIVEKVPVLLVDSDMQVILASSTTSELESLVNICAKYGIKMKDNIVVALYSPRSQSEIKSLYAAGVKIMYFLKFYSTKEDFLQLKFLPLIDVNFVDMENYYYITFCPRQWYED